MTAHNEFILRNLMRVRDKFWAFDTDAVDNLVDAFRDELRKKFNLTPEYASVEPDYQEKAFEKRARKIILSIFTLKYDNNTISHQ